MDVRHYSRRYPGDWQILLGMLLFLASALWVGESLQGGEYFPNTQWHLGHLGKLAGGVIYMIGYYRTTTAKGYPPLVALAGFTAIIGLIVILVLPDITHADDIAGPRVRGTEPNTNGEQ